MKNAKKIKYSNVACRALVAAGFSLQGYQFSTNKVYVEKDNKILGFCDYIEAASILTIK